MKVANVFKELIMVCKSQLTYKASVHLPFMYLFGRRIITDFA
jgi:hypothetical protein